MLDFGGEAALDSAPLGDEDIAAVKAHGFDDEAVWDIGAITASSP